MTTEQLKRKLKKIIIDLQDFYDEPYLDLQSKSDIEDATEVLERIAINVYSTEV